MHFMLLMTKIFLIDMVSKVIKHVTIDYNTNYNFNNVIGIQ